MNFMKLVWHPIASGVWSATIGEPLTLTFFSGQKPAFSGNGELTEKSLDFIKAEQQNGSAVLLDPLS